MIKLCAFADEAGNSVSEQIAALRRNGVSMLEIRSVSGKNVSVLTEDEAKQIASELSENGITVWSIGSPLGKVDISVDFSKYMETVEHVCRLADIFGTKRIRMFSFYTEKFEGDKNDLADRVIEGLRQMLEVADRHGITLCHENEKEIFGDTAERVKLILDALPDLKCIYDPANFLQCGERAEKTIPMFSDRIDYLHVKDAQLKTGAVVPAGYGDGKIAELVKGLRGDYTFTVEPHLADFMAYAAIDRTELKHAFSFKDNQEAFDFAIQSAKSVLTECGYIEDENGNYVLEKNNG